MSRPTLRGHRRLPALFTTCAALLLGACGIIDVGGGRPADVRPAGFPECVSDTYDFAGRATLGELGLDGFVPAPLPDPDRVAMIWITHDPVEHDLGEEGGPTTAARMLCFEFEDGSGGSGWPVDAAWRAPSQAAAVGDDAGPLPLVAVAIGAIVLLGVSILAFRRDRAERGR